MAHPYKGKCSTDREAGRARYRAEGGRIDPSTGSYMKTGNARKPELDIPGGSPGTYYGTSMEPGPRGYKVEGPYATGSRARKVYDPTPEGRKSATRMMDKMDNEYGAYRHRRKTLTDGME